MGYRTISVPDEVYERLYSLKKENESFNKLLLRLVGRERSKLRSFFGKWKMTDAEERRMFNELGDSWKKWK